MSTADRKVNTPKAILSYPNLDVARKPQEGQAGDPKFSATLVFAPGTDLSALEAAAVAAVIEKLGKTTYGPKNVPILEAMRKGHFKSPFRTDADAKGYAEGSTFINARSKTKPGTVYGWNAPGTSKPANVEESKIKDVFYAGSLVRANLTAFWYDTSGNKGVSFALNHVQWLGDGPRLDNRTSAENEFDAPLGEAPVDISSLTD